MILVCRLRFIVYKYLQIFSNKFGLYYFWGYICITQKENNMKIQLLTQEQHDEILTIYKSFPELTLENKGYEGIYRAGLSIEAKEADIKINTILKSSIVGFSTFQNFCHTKDGEIRLRLQYNWGAEDNSMSFTGVGYILLTELLNGFTENSIKS